MSTVPADDVLGTERSWTEMTRAGVRLVALACCVANLLGGAGVAFSQVQRTPTSLLGLSLAVAGLLTVAAAVGGRRHRGWLTALAVGFSAAGMAFALPATSWTHGPSAWWPGPFVITVTGFLVYMHPSWRGWLLVGVVVAANAAARVTSWPSDKEQDGTPVLVPQLAFETGQLVMMATATSLTLTALYAAAARADAARTAARSRRQAQQQATASAVGSREVDRFIHDEVLATLQCLAMDRSAVSAQQATQAARRMTCLLEGTPGVSARPAEAVAPAADLTAMLDEVAAASPLRVQLQVARPLSVPPGVGDAIARAVEESLRNVTRHAGTNHASVRVRRRGITVTVTVRDQGRGFDPDAVDRRRRGVSSSIAQRLRDVGGSATIRSRPGHGTTVVLRWAPQLDGGPRPRRGIAAAGMARLAPVGMAAYLPFLVANLWFVIWMAPQLTVPAAGWAATVTVVAAGLAATVIGLRSKLLAWHSVALTAVAWAASLANGLALPLGSANPALYWLAGGVTPVVYLQVLLRPLREAVVTGIGLTAIAVGCSLRAGEGAAQLPLYLPAVLSPALALACAVLLGRTVDRMSWEVLRSEEAAIEAAQRHRSDLAEQLRERVDRPGAAVLDFVRSVAQGRLDPAEPEVRSQAAELERTVRDRLLQRVPAAVSAAEARLLDTGMRVRLRAAPGMPDPVAEAVVQALDSLARASVDPAGTGLQLTAAPSSGCWRIALVVAGDAAALSAWSADLAGREPGWTVSTGEGGIHLVRRLPLRVPSMTDSP